MLTDLARCRIAVAQAYFLALCLDDSHAIVREDLTAWLDSCAWALELEQKRTEERCAGSQD